MQLPSNHRTGFVAVTIEPTNYRTIERDSLQLPSNQRTIEPSNGVYMIIGIGIDLVDVKRFEAIIFRWQHKFLKRVFTDTEIRYCNTKKHPAQRFATRFAAKEAFIKALFPKDQEGVRYSDIEIGEREHRPMINLAGKVKDLAAKRKISHIHLMLSHDGDYGIANVVLEG